MEPIVQIIRPGAVVPLITGDHFKMLLPDGRELHFEQTQDYFSITNSQGLVVYSRPTSESGELTATVLGGFGSFSPYLEN